VRLVNGTSLCSGRLEVKSDQSDQSWSSVCEDDFDQQDAEVVCRELGCGAPSVLQGALYGDGQSLMWTKEFQCEGHESVLLDCHNHTCSTETVVIVSEFCENLRLLLNINILKTKHATARHVGAGNSLISMFKCCYSSGWRRQGATSVANMHTLSLMSLAVKGSTNVTSSLFTNYFCLLRMKQMGTWEKVDNDMSLLNLKTADVVCGQLDCGSAVSTRNIMNEFYAVMWLIRTTCVQPKTAVREFCLLTFTFQICFCPKLVNGTSLCSGRLEVKSDQSDQSWSSVCEDDFDRQDAEVVCRELGCGVPSVLQGALYGESESPMWTKEFQCEGHESVLLDCRSSARNTGSAGKAPDEVKLVGGSNHCVGGLELKHEGNWRPVDIYSWDLVSAAVVCRQLDCGSALSIGRRDDLMLQTARPFLLCSLY
uniref:SRCR domain-containing protein n=1 Tax=Cyclopterus lumpus TaxID=8103 RepID=A0A8C2X292_CYCLU